MEEYWDEFVTEVYDSLESLYNEIEEFYQGHQDTALEAIARVLHNIKGTSGALGHKLLSDVTHQIETQFLTKINSEKVQQIPYCVNIYEQVLKLVVQGPKIDITTLRPLMREIALDIDSEGKVVTFDSEKSATSLETSTIENPKAAKLSKVKSWSDALKDYEKPKEFVDDNQQSDINDFITRMKGVNTSSQQTQTSSNTNSPQLSNPLSPSIHMGKQTLIQLIYVSDLAEDVSLLMLDKILQKAESKNNQNGISGCLVLYERKILQVLEGESDKVNQLYHKIAIDPAHSNVSLLSVKSLRFMNFHKWSRLVIPKSYIGDQLQQIRSLGMIEEDIVFPRKNAALDLLVENFAQFYK